MATAYQSLQACFMRVTLLDDDGSALVGPDSVFTTDAFTIVENTLVIKEGDSFQLVNACGSVCASYEDCDRIQATEGSTTLCQLDAQLIAMMTAGKLLVDAVAAPVGYAVPDYNASCPNGFALEVWTKAWNGNQPAVDGPDRLWMRWFWPRMLGVLGNTTLENGILEVPVTMKGSANSTLTATNGPDADWPDDIGASPFGWFQTVDTPTVAAGPTAFPIV